MPARTHTKDEVEYFRAKISELHLKRWKQRDIAQQLGISPAMVSHYHCLNKAELKKNRLTDPIVAREEQLAALDLIERDAWATLDKAQQRRLTTADLQIKNDSAIAKIWQVLLTCQKCRKELYEGDLPNVRFDNTNTDVDFEGADIATLSQALADALSAHPPVNPNALTPEATPASGQSGMNVPERSRSKSTHSKSTGSKSAGAKRPTSKSKPPVRGDPAESADTDAIEPDASYVDLVGNQSPLTS
jgi:predicted transcriptional regulator